MRLDNLIDGTSVEHPYGAELRKVCPHMTTSTTHQDQSSKMDKLEIPVIMDEDNRSMMEILDDASLMLRAFGLSDDIQKARLTEIAAEIAQRNDGTYTHTLHELELGSRLAWKLSSRCIMRAAANSLIVRDCRWCTTPSEMNHVLVSHLRECQVDGVLKAMISIFPPKEAGKRGFRVWNPHLYGFAGYKLTDGTIIGDPSNVTITEHCILHGYALKLHSISFQSSFNHFN
jgi:nitric oxide synthase oxygenase domain/subunit